MAALPVIPNVIRCVISGVCPSGQPWANTFHVEKEPASSFGAAANAIQTEVLKIYGIAVPYGVGTEAWGQSASNLARMTQQRYTLLDGVTASALFNVTRTGLLATNPMPSDTAVVVSEQTAKRGPRYRGRIYLPGYTESMNDANGTIDATTRTNMTAGWVAFANALFASVDLGGMVVASYKYATAEPVTVLTINERWDRQKRRN